MGIAQTPKPAKFLLAFLISDRGLWAQAEQELVSLFGPIDQRSEVLPWSESQYYQSEMGDNLHRGFISFERLALPDGLAQVKLATNALEDRFRDRASTQRRINLDPAYLDAFKVVLASTKNARQRIYLSSGIYAEATLFYSNGEFHGLPYTYTDYLWPQSRRFFSESRRAYLAQLRQRH